MCLPCVCGRAGRISCTAISPPVLWEKSSACWIRALLNLLHKGLPLRNVAQAAAENPSWDLSLTGQDIHCSIYGLTVLVEMYFTSASDELDEGKQGKSSSEGFFLYLICFLNHWNEDVCLAQWWVNMLAFPRMPLFRWLDLQILTVTFVKETQRHTQTRRWEEGKKVFYLPGGKICSEPHSCKPALTQCHQSRYPSENKHTTNTQIKQIPKEKRTGSLKSQVQKKTYSYIHRNSRSKWQNSLAAQTYCEHQAMLQDDTSVWSACVLFQRWVPRLSQNGERQALPRWWTSLMRLGHSVWNSQPRQPSTHNLMCYHSAYNAAILPYVCLQAYFKSKAELTIEMQRSDRKGVSFESF